MSSDHQRRPVRRPGRSDQPARAKEIRHRHLRRQYPPRFIACGVACGFILAVVFGVFVVYADMMSRVTYAKGDDDSFWKIQNLLDDDFLSDYALIHHNAPGQDPADADDPSDLESPPQETLFLEHMAGVENILLLGVDTHSYTGRSDVTMLISINHNTKKINIVSLMRAMYVKIGAKNHDRGLLNAAYSYGGPTLAMKVVEQNFGIPITGFVAVNFTSFVRIVNAIGGVGITLTPGEARILRLPSGYNRLNGQQALDYSRIRKLDSDFQRNQRQRNVINSILNEMTSQGGASAYKAATVILANTYTNIDLNSYIMKAPTYLSYARSQLQIPDMSETRQYYVGGQEVWWFDLAKTHQRIVEFLLK